MTNVIQIPKKIRDQYYCRNCVNPSYVLAESIENGAPKLIIICVDCQYEATPKDCSYKGN